jgi:hypothetical protein
LIVASRREDGFRTPTKLPRSEQSNGTARNFKPREQMLHSNPYFSLSRAGHDTWWHWRASRSAARKRLQGDGIPQYPRVGLCVLGVISDARRTCARGAGISIESSDASRGTEGQLSAAAAATAAAATLQTPLRVLRETVSVASRGTGMASADPHGSEAPMAPRLESGSGGARGVSIESSDASRGTEGQLSAAAAAAAAVATLQTPLRVLRETVSVASRGTEMASADPKGSEAPLAPRSEIRAWENADRRKRAVKCCAFCLSYDWV